MGESTNSENRQPKTGPDDPETGKTEAEDIAASTDDGIAYIRVAAGYGTPPTTPKPKAVTPIDLKGSKQEAESPPKKD